MAASPCSAGETNKLFAANCASCHGPDGKAHTPIARRLGVKDLSESRLTAEQIAQQIRSGSKDAKGSQKMPAFSDRLTEEEVKSLVSQVQQFQKNAQ